MTLDEVDLVVIGVGPVGMIAALRAADPGAATRLGSGLANTTRQK